MRLTLSEQNNAKKTSSFLLSRRRLLKAVVATGITVFGRAGFSLNQESKLEESINESLDALARRQNKDGSFGSSSTLFGRDPASAALVGLAFLASGSLPGRGRYGRELDNIVDFLCRSALKTKGVNAGDVFAGLDSASRLAALHYLEENQLSSEDVDGLIVDFSEKGRKPTYGHGYATLFLSEVFGTVNRQDAREITKAAVNLIARTQNSAGGWRYDPKKVEVADISVSTCLLSALRSARNAGIHVPVDTINDAEKYILSLQNKDGGFRYMSLDGPSGFSRTAASIHALQSSGSKNAEAIRRAFGYLEKVYPVGADQEEKRTGKIEYWSYGQFYAALSYWKAAVDDRGRERARLFFRRFVNDAMARRGSDGIWKSAISSEIETAFILCALSTPRERAPFFLR